MHGSSQRVVEAAPTIALESGDGAAGLRGLIGRLTGVFGAPAGLLDPRRGTWVSLSEPSASVFPKLGPALVGATLVTGHASVWKGDEAEGRIWLLVPLVGPDGPLVGVVGFATAAAPSTESSVRWGPPCPEPALIAWGQTVVDQFRASYTPRPAEPNGGVASADRIPTSPRFRTSTEPDSGEGDRQLVARLIRRLRISDSPVRFQQMATTALKTALGVEAVAWVPTHHAESVVVAGEVGRLRGNGFRSLLPNSEGKGQVHIVNLPDTPPDPAVHQTLAVAADAQGAAGWLIAVNTPAGRPFTAADAEPLRPVASLIATQQINARVYADLKELLFGVIRALTSAIDAKDPYTSGHSERVARIAVRLGEELGMSANQRGDLYLMGLLHDVGKIGVDDAVLKKPGPLTPEEYRQIQSHVEIGVHILSDLKKLNHLLPGVRHHHESLDGTGYPCGLAGDAIPFEARILAVADSYDAMSSTRPYRRRLTPSQIDEILRKGSGIQWDPRVIDALFECRMDLEMIRQKGLGESLQLAVSETLGRS